MRQNFVLHKPVSLLMGSEAPSGGGSHSTTLKSNNFAIFHNFKHPPSSKKMRQKFSKKSLNQENLFFFFRNLFFNYNPMVQFLLTGIITQVKQSMNNCWLFKITRLITSSLIHFRSKTNIKTTLDIFVSKLSCHPVIFLGQ